MEDNLNNNGTPVSSGKGLSIAGLVLGIYSCIFAWIYLVNISAIVFGLIGVVLAALGRKQAKAANQTSGIGTAGLVLSIIGLSLGFIGFMSCTLCVICAAEEVGEGISSLY